MGFRLLVHPGPVIANHEFEVRSRREIHGHDVGGSVQVGVCGLDRESASPRHGVAGVERQVDDDLLDLPRVGLHPFQVRPGDRHQLDVFPDEALEHLLQVGNDQIQIQDLRLEDLFAAERDQLLRQSGGALARLSDLLESPGHETGIRQTLLRQPDVSRDHRHQVVEIVGNPARKSSHRLDFLGLEQPLLQMLPSRDIPGEDLESGPSIVLDRRGRYLHIHPGSVRPDECLLQELIFPEVLPDLVIFAPREKVRDRFPEELRGPGSPEKTDRRVVHEDEFSVLLDIDRFRREFHQVPVSLFALPESVFRTFSLEQDDDRESEGAGCDQAIEDPHVILALGGQPDPSETDQPRADRQEEQRHPSRRDIGCKEERD